MNPKKTILSIGLSIVLGLWVYAVLAQQVTDRAPIRAVESVGMTVSDMARSSGFYSKVLSFEKVSDIEV